MTSALVYEQERLQEALRVGDSAPVAKVCTNIRTYVLLQVEGMAELVGVVNHIATMQCTISKLADQYMEEQHAFKRM